MEEVFRIRRLTNVAGRSDAIKAKGDSIDDLLSDVLNCAQTAGKTECDQVLMSTVLRRRSLCGLTDDSDCSADVKKS